MRVVDGTGKLGKYLLEGCLILDFHRNQENQTTV